MGQPQLLLHKSQLCAVQFKTLPKWVWQIFSFIFKSVEMRLNTQGQNVCHQAAYIIYAATPTSMSCLVVSCTRSIILSVLVQYFLSSTRALNNVVVSRYTAQESVDWRNQHVDMVLLLEEEEEPNGG